VAGRSAERSEESVQSVLFPVSLVVDAGRMTAAMAGARARE
jgi:hypothetical protein